MWEKWISGALNLAPMEKYVMNEEVLTVNGHERVLTATFQNIKPSKLNGRQRLLMMHEDVTEKRKMERKLAKKRKKIERMDEPTKTLMKFFEHSPMLMSSVCIRDDDIEFRLVNPAKLDWLSKHVPNVKELYAEGKPLTGSKFSSFEQ
jgi:hypothetical protein